ncbi:MULTISPECIES: hypothetical protein [unclassified Clostridium]|uniref:hypothetical protein n=1 Tax=unclassified Clostridium TaxID=2614128 RepID=UPI0013F76705|nr:MULTISPECIES: hypothetical protein [unclassified Clostridium]NFR86804.1 hypothetical protein [Clostridium botulinum]NFR91362.1 hypothetical protein [Clostridium botulinum]NFT99010.1 hypothetical protein [Clostridium botulinum]
MKIKKMMLGALVGTMVIGGSVNAFAAVQNNENFNIYGEIQTYEDGEMPEMPEGAVEFNKEIIEGVSSDIQTYKEGEMPEMPEGAVEFNKEIIEGASSEIQTYEDGEMPKMPEGAVKLNMTIMKN